VILNFAALIEGPMARIDELTGEWDYTLLPDNVVLGQGCWIENKGSFSRFRSTQTAGLVLGHHTKVYTWSAFSVESAGQLIIGNNCILVGAMLMCAQRIQIGDNVLISYGVTISDSDFHPTDPGERRRDAMAIAPGGDMARPSISAVPVTIRDDVSIGIGAIILKGVTIGKGARVGAGAVVTKDVEEGSYVTGNPGKPVM
jgi:acetyltransferase-like isoleucine patch superfamily enzyme